jgi:hypothetical protein
MIPTLALSIRQPWAWFILYAGKDVENRSWPTRYRGRVLIHAGRAFDDDDLDVTLNLFAWAPAGMIPPTAAGLPRGGIVGEAEIVDCVTSSDSEWFEGPYGLVLRNARPLPFRRCRGRLGFFKPDFEAAP